MTKNRLRVLLALIATGAVFASPAVAKADDGIDQFLYDAHALGWHGRSAGDGDLIRNGYLVCQMLHRYNGADVAEAVYLNTGWDVTRQDAANFVIISSVNLCPETDHRGSGYAAVTA